MANWLGAAIGGAADLIGGFLDRGEARDQVARAEAFNREVFDWQKKYVQHRVEDARKAGIHPLYALGTPGVSASFSTSPTGTTVGEGLSRAGSRVDRYLGSRNIEKAQIGVLDSQRKLNEVEAMAIDSERKTRESEVNWRQDGEWNTLPSGALVRALPGEGEKPSSGWKKLPDTLLRDHDGNPIFIPPQYQRYAERFEEHFGEAGEVMALKAFIRVMRAHERRYGRMNRRDREKLAKRFGVEADDLVY